MRRFELSEGTSHKFWHIAQDGVSVRVQFGRIGTNGQTQVKSFASADAAKTEVDKLVREKLKKGYTEVEGVDLAAPAPEAMPAASASSVSSVSSVSSELAPAPDPEPDPPAAPTPARAGVIAWTDAALREVAPIRGSDVVAARKPDAKAAYAKIAKGVDAFRELLDAGAMTPGAQKERMAAARAAFAERKVPEKLELEAQAAAYALLADKVIYQDVDRADDFVRYWSAIVGGEFTLRALALAFTMEVQVEDESLAIVDREADKVPWWRLTGGNGWRALRAMVVRASDAEHAALLELAESIAQGATIVLRARLAAAFERPEWITGDLQMATPQGRNTSAWFWPQLVSVRSMGEARELLERAGTPSLWQTTHAVQELRYDFVARYGAPAGEFLRELIASQAGKMGTDLVRDLAEALALIVTDDVAAFFTQQLAARELRAIAATYLTIHPEVSLAPLAQAAAGKGAIADAAKGLLRTIVSSSKEGALSAAKASLSPAALQLLAQMEAQDHAFEEAAEDEVPRVLRASSRPSKRSPAKSAKDVVELAPLPFEESLEYAPGERERKRSYRWLEEQPDKVAENLAMLHATNEAKGPPLPSSWHQRRAAIFTHLPKEALLEVLSTMVLSRFDWSSYPIADTILSRHGIELLDFAIRSAEVDAVGAVHALVRARSARVAPLMAHAFMNLKKARPAAIGWLLAFPEAAAVGLIPPALGAASAPREAAGRALRYLAARGHGATLEAVATKYGPAAEEGLRAVLDLDPFLVFLAKSPKMPAFWEPRAFARPLLAGRKKALPLPAMDKLGAMLVFTTPDDPYVGIGEVKEACDPKSLAAFAWDLFQAWLLAGAPSKEQWAFHALGLLGDDESARKLTPLIRAWPGEAAHARAVMGLDVLARIGTDVALMHLHGIAQKLKFKGLQEKAREKIQQVAEDRGLTSDELADRLVPDLGLDERGSLRLDFGPRAFRVLFDEMLKPAVMDDAGNRLPDLPKPKQSDDGEKAKEAVETWKALKKDAKTIASGQIVRLEIAMCAERRWPVDVFRAFFVEHPLLIHVVRRLVWGVYDADGKLGATFRVAEDNTFTDGSDNDYALADDARVGIVHRLELDLGSSAAWGQIFADYEILQPFAQLSRETATPTEAEKSAKKLERVVGVTVPTGRVLGLDPRGWRRGPPQDAGVVCWYEKPLGDGLTACLDLEPGIYTGMISESPQQTLGAVTLARGENRWHNEESAPFSELSPIGFSELLRDLESLLG